MSHLLLSLGVALLPVLCITPSSSLVLCPSLLLLLCNAAALHHPSLLLVVSLSLYLVAEYFVGMLLGLRYLLTSRISCWLAVYPIGGLLVFPSWCCVTYLLPSCSLYSLHYTVYSFVALYLLCSACVYSVTGVLQLLVMLGIGLLLSS